MTYHLINDVTDDIFQRPYHRERLSFQVSRESETSKILLLLKKSRNKSTFKTLRYIFLNLSILQSFP